MTAQSVGSAAVHSIDHFALNVPSLEQAEHFYENFGLTVTRHDGELHLHAADNHRWGRLLASDHKSLAYLSFACHKGELETIRAQAQAAGADFNRDSSLKTGEGIWFHDPDGNLIQVKEGARTMPTSKTPFHVPVAQENQRGAYSRSEGGRLTAAHAK